MAATGTPTPNIGLRIPQGTDPASVDDINYNSNLLDTKIGAIGNDSVKTQLDALNSKLDKFVELGEVSNLNISDRAVGKCYHMTYRTSATGIPVANNGGHSFLFINSDLSTYGSQIAYSNGGCYFRILSNGTYGAWVRLDVVIKYSTYMIPSAFSINAHSSAQIGDTATIFNLPAGATVLTVTTGLDGSNIGLCFAQASGNGNTYIYNAGTSTANISTSTKLLCLYI